jgi:glycosyltransferase 2 family protein
MKPKSRCWVLPGAKLLLAVTLFAVIGRRFCQDLLDPQLGGITIQLGWASLSASVYLLGLSFSAVYWYRLLRKFGQQPRLFTAMRAHYVSQLGKYIPGKAWVVVIRSMLVAGPGVRLSVAVVATFYEVLMTMSGGVVFSAIVFTLQPPSGFKLGTHVLLGPGLLAAVVIVFLPGVSLAVGRRLGERFELTDGYQCPKFDYGSLFEGLVIATMVWMAFGLSLWAIVQALGTGAPPLTASVWFRYSAIVATANAAGFVVVVVPAGLGVREWICNQFLGPELTSCGVMPVAPVTAMIVLMLRLISIGAEMVLAAVVYLLPGPWIWIEKQKRPAPMNTETDQVGGSFPDLR